MSLSRPSRGLVDPKISGMGEGNRGSGRQTPEGKPHGPASVSGDDRPSSVPDDKPRSTSDAKSSSTSGGSSTLNSRSPTPEEAMPQEPDAEKTAPPALPFEKEAQENYKPKTLKFWLIILSTFISIFLVALDRTILSTAVPSITDDFKSLGDIGWYGSAYMLTTAAFQLVFGRVYRFYDLKWTLMGSIVVFEVGSAICGAAPNSPIFIFGRSIAGVGSAGIMTGSVMVIVPMVPLHKRPVFQSMFGMVFGIASVAGPLVGGAFTERVSWRWCFYMNLPVGFAALVFLFLFLRSPETPQTQATVKEHIMRLDPLGTLFFIPAVLSLVFALQWGGTKYPWDSWRLIVLFVCCGVATIAFAAVQILMPKSASLPARVITQRSIFAGTWYMLFLAGAMMLCVYYIPLWFQTTHGVNAIDSGIYTIPLVLSLVVASIIGGAFTQRIGYYVPAMITSPCIMATGEGLLTTFQPDTGSPHWIAYQFLVGFGLGFGMQTVSLAAQTILPKEDIPIGMAISFFAQQLGGAIFVSVGQTILSSVLVDKLQGVPGLDAEVIISTGATNLHSVVPAEYLETVINAYNYAITRIFFAALGLSGAQLLCSLFMQWKSIKKGKKGPSAPPAQETPKKVEETTTS